MHILTESQLKYIALHQVGNKQNDEGLILSSKLHSFNTELKTVLETYFFNAFKNINEYYHLYHETNINLNEIYNYITTILEHPDSLYEQSKNIAKHLYEQTTHPKIKSGEFYVAYFTDLIINGETVSGVGLFKSENKDTFLQIIPSNSNFEIECQIGNNINKLDKGCLIFNKEKENGYIVAIIDNTSKGSDAQYWIDDFLHVRQRKDEYYNTQNVLSLCKNFVTKELPQQFEVSKADQADLLNKSVKFFKEKETFNMDEFANEVIAQPEIIDSFNGYKSEYQKEHDIEITDSFTISDSAVKKQSRILKSVIKLDKNFHIYVHGNNQYIKKGYDEETGLYYYQLFFKEEV